jgi:hypothetical protein
VGPTTRASGASHFNGTHRCTIARDEGRGKGRDKRQVKAGHSEDTEETNHTKKTNESGVARKLFHHFTILQKVADRHTHTHSLSRPSHRSSVSPCWSVYVDLTIITHSTCQVADVQ